MLSFLKSKQRLDFDFKKIGVDMHSHLIPGIDDGAKTIEDALDLIRHLKQLGYEKIITTPHVYQEYYPNKKADILRGAENIREALSKANISMPIEAAAEYFLDEHFENLLAKDEVLTLKGKYLLVEMSFYGPPPRLYDYLYQIQMKGLRPILAHPERYLFLKDDFSEFERLKQAGCLLQMNILSLKGYYSDAVKSLAHKLLEYGLIDFLGTDLHHKKHLEHLKNLDFPSKTHALISNYCFKNKDLLI